MLTTALNWPFNRRDKFVPARCLPPTRFNYCSSGGAADRAAPLRNISAALGRLVKIINGIVARHLPQESGKNRPRAAALNHVACDRGRARGQRRRHPVPTTSPCPWIRPCECTAQLHTRASNTRMQAGAARLIGRTVRITLARNPGECLFHWEKMFFFY